METLGPGLYEVGLQYQTKKRGKVFTQYFEPFLASGPAEAIKKALNALYILTGKEVIIKENLITLIIPNEDYFSKP